jgi:hypothetical protein
MRVEYAASRQVLNEKQVQQIDFQKLKQLQTLQTTQTQL